MRISPFVPVTYEAVRRLAAELEGGELILIEAVSDGGATWSQISVALGTRIPVRHSEEK